MFTYRAGLAHTFHFWGYQVTIGKLLIIPDTGYGKNLPPNVGATLAVAHALGRHTRPAPERRGNPCGCPRVRILSYPNHLGIGAREQRVQQRVGFVLSPAIRIKRSQLGQGAMAEQ